MYAGFLVLKQVSVMIRQKNSRKCNRFHSILRVRIEGGRKMNILLVCAAGMSTSLLVSKMQKAAEAESKTYHIQAVSADQAKKHIEQAEVLLLGPQVRYMLPQMKKLGEERGIPVDVINSVDYGTGNGKNVLHHAESLFAKKG